MDVSNIVNNQLLYADGDDECKAASQMEMQKKYLEEINDLYELYQFSQDALCAGEVRGLDNFKEVQ